MITLLYSESLKEITMKEKEQISYQPGLSVAVIKKMLADSYGTGIGPLLEASEVAVNDEYVEEVHGLEDGDELKFAPPVKSN